MPPPHLQTVTLHDNKYYIEITIIGTYNIIIIVPENIVQNPRAQLD